MARQESDWTQRIATLVNEGRWAGSQTRFATDVGCSPSVISKILAGRQKPGSRLIQRLLKLENVNPEWLLSGEGEPWLAEAADRTCALPVSSVVLPGDPRESKEQLTGESFPIAEAFYRPTRYFLRLSRHHSILAWRPYALAEGDLLLLETNPGYWRDASVLHKRICAIQEDGVASLRSVQVEHGEPDGRGPLEIRIERYEDAVDRALVFTETKGGRPFRMKGAERVPVSQSQLTIQGHLINSSQILAAGLLVVRRLGC